ncbi:hypothetical protein C1645_755522 [Glomus cerebriforme]|uniref:Uncharacterized protein n=1 Tax=Glomus cerebriforme TaxID=658196 RepID=A0A397TMZ3_9GLOM|nr:hypothetical protein C1645_755522 [Glomus cerebriforme]
MFKEYIPRLLMYYLSIGCILVEILSGKPLFSRRDCIFLFKTYKNLYHFIIL